MPLMESDWSSVSKDGIISSHKGGVREDEVGRDDATWIVTSAFIVFTMQSGR